MLLEAAVTLHLPSFLLFSFPEMGEESGKAAAQSDSVGDGLNLALSRNYKNTTKMIFKQLHISLE